MNTNWKKDCPHFAESPLTTIGRKELAKLNTTEKVVKSPLCSKGRNGPDGPECPENCPDYPKMI